jgi:hypothetical protein
VFPQDVEVSRPSIVDAALPNDARDASVMTPPSDAVAPTDGASMEMGDSSSPTVTTDAAMTGDKDSGPPVIAVDAGDPGCMTELILDATADATLDSLAPTSKLGEEPPLSVGRAGILHAAIRFELPANLSEVSNLRATLVLTKSGGTGSGDVGVHAIAKTWDEADVTWQRADQPMSSAWTSPGGDFAAAATDVVNLPDSFAVDAMLTWDVTVDVSAVIGGAQHFGWMLLGVASGGFGAGESVGFYSKEGPEQGPKLVISSCNP